MITKLTQTQKDLLLIYRNKWINIGVRTVPIDLKKAKTLSDYYYNNILKIKAVPIAVFPSPLTAWIAVSAQVSAQVCDQVRDQVYVQVCDQVSDQVRDQVYAQVHNQIHDQVRDQIRDQVYDQARAQVSAQVSAQVCDQVRAQVSAQVRDQVRAQIHDQVYDQVRDQVRAQVSAQVRDQVRAQIHDQVYAQVRDQVHDQIHDQVHAEYIWPYIDGNYDAAYYSYINYLCDVLDCKIDNQHYSWYSDLQNISLYYPLTHIAILSDFPEYIHMKDNRLHSDGTPAIKYKDGFSVWVLNGVRVTKEIAETPAEKLDPKLILNEQNVDVQREIIKKIGAEKVLKKLNAKCLDKWTDPKTGKYYELQELKVNNLNRKYLYYEHASLKGYYYAMPIPPECKKAIHARAWILGIIERKELSDINQLKELEIGACLPQYLS